MNYDSELKNKKKHLLLILIPSQPSVPRYNPYCETLKSIFSVDLLLLLLIWRQVVGAVASAEISRQTTLRWQFRGNINMYEI